MKLFFILAVIGLSIAQRIDDGRYYPSDEGQYKPDNSGSYNGADDGSYRPDNSGAYNPDDSGRYAGQADKYVHTPDRFGGSGGAGGGSGGSGGAGAGGGFIGGGRRPAVIVAVQPARVNTGSLTGTRLTSSSGTYKGSNVDSGTYKPRSGSDSASGYYDNRNYRIIRQEGDVDQDGYHYLYETENKILGEEQGRLANVGNDNEAMQASGYFEYTGPDNVVYRVDYTANENGFVPTAAHLPTPPPIPEAILRSLEYQRSRGEL